MKILVTVKRVVDYNVRVHVLPDHSGVDIATAKMSMNPFDEIAVEAAVRLKEKKQVDEVVAVSIGGPKTVDTLRVAMAMGADRSIHVSTAATLEPLATARVLARICRDENPDLVIMGKQAIDDDAFQVPQMLSSMLGWPIATCINRLETGGGRVRVVRETDLGLLTVSAELPAIVSTDLRLTEPRYVTLPAMMKAKRKPVKTVDAASLGVNLSSRTTLLEAVDPPARAAGIRLNSVDELIDKLRNTAKVL